VSVEAVVIALAPLAVTIVRLLAEGKIGHDCVGELCQAHPELRPALDRLRLSEMRDAITAARVARGADAAESIYEARARALGADVTLAALIDAAEGEEERATLERILRRSRTRSAMVAAEPGDPIA
jgi:hypothetical protein